MSSLAVCKHTKMDYGYKNSLSKRTLILLLLCMYLFGMQELFVYRGDCKEIAVVETIEFNKGFAPLFGDGNILHSHDDKSVNLHLNQYTGLYLYVISIILSLWIIYVM